MSIVLANFSTGDSGYIAKLNQNNSILVTAINALQAITDSGTTTAVTVLLYSFISALCPTTTIFGSTGVVGTPSGTSLIFTPGFIWMPSIQKVVTCIGGPLSFAGLPDGTYYVIVDSTGQLLQWATFNVDSLYSVDITGGAIGTVTKLALTLAVAA